MDPIFEHPVFDTARERVKCVIRHLKNPKKNLKTRCTLVSNVGATMYFPSQNRLGLLAKERLYSTNVVIVAINRGMDDNVK